MYLRGTGTPPPPPEPADSQKKIDKGGGHTLLPAKPKTLASVPLLFFRPKIPALQPMGAVCESIER